MKPYLWIYRLGLDNGEQEIGTFSTTVNIFEGNTEEQVAQCLTWVANENDIPREDVKDYQIRRVGEEFLDGFIKEYAKCIV